MHPRIHVSISYSFKKKIKTCHASSHHVIHHTPRNHFQKNKEIKKKSAMIIFLCVSLTNVRPSRGVCQHFKSKILVLLLYIKTLYEAMVIDFLCHIEAFCEAMVIGLFTSRPSTRQWSLISYVTSRPSTRQWSLISSHQDPLRDNGH